jgi:gliding motility-associated-like protein
MDGCPSPLSNALNTIFVKAEIDTCNYRIALTWNSYQSVPKKVIDYSILLSVNNGAFTEAGKVITLTNNFVLTDFTTYTQYSFIIRANLEDGTISTSNITSLTTRLPRPPLWINADYATVNSDNKISLSFTIDPAAEITHFILERKAGKEEIFKEIAQPVSVNGSVTITDDQADVGIINFYRLSAINSCKNPVIVSNLCSNIVLSLERPDNNLSFSWNPYKQWRGGISSYRLFMDSGQGYVEKMVIQPTDSVLTLEYQSIMYQVTGNEVCFYLDASEASNPYGVSGHSNSSVICTLPTVNITVPNVFTPNNDLVNDFFKPVLTFTPADYHLIISDRQGNVLFDTRDFNAAWDGSRNGIPQPQGVCLWFLKVTTPTGKSITRTGTLTIIKDK